MGLYKSQQKVMERRVSKEERHQRLSLLHQMMQPQQLSIHLIAPDRFRFFHKDYKLTQHWSDIDLLLSDSHEYQALLSGQKDRLLDQKRMGEEHSPSVESMSQLLSYYDLFVKRSSEQLTKLAKIVRGKEEKPDMNTFKSTVCSVCEKKLQQHHLQVLKKDLKINEFEDVHSFYNFNRLDAMDDEDEVDRLNEKAFTMTLEEYDQILNAIGSGIHSKNIEIEKIVRALNGAESVAREGENNAKLAQQKMDKIPSTMSADFIKKNMQKLLSSFYKRIKDHKKDHETSFGVQVCLDGEKQKIQSLEDENRKLKESLRQALQQKTSQNTNFTKRLSSMRRERQNDLEKFKVELQKVKEEKGDRSVKEGQLQIQIKVLYKELEEMSSNYASLLAQTRTQVAKPKKKQTFAQPQADQVVRLPVNKSNKLLKSSLNQKMSDKTSGGYLNTIFERNQECQGADDASLASYKSSQSNSSVKNGKNSLLDLRTDSKTRSQDDESKMGENEEGGSKKRRISRFKVMAPVRTSGTLASLTKGSLTSLDVFNEFQGGKSVFQSRETHEKRGINQRYRASIDKMALLKQLYFWEGGDQEYGEDFDSFINLYENLVDHLANSKVENGLFRQNKQRKTCFTSFTKNKSKSATKAQLLPQRQAGVSRSRIKVSSKDIKHQKGDQARSVKVLKPLGTQTNAIKKRKNNKGFSEHRSGSVQARNTKTAEPHFGGQQGKRRQNVDKMSIYKKQVSQQRPIYEIKHEFNSFQYINPQSLNNLFKRQNTESQNKNQKGQGPPLGTQHSKIIMKVMTLLATLRLRRPTVYKELSFCLHNLPEALNHVPGNSLTYDPVHEQSIKSAVENIVSLHTSCDPDLHPGSCCHLTTLVNLMQNLISWDGMKVSETRLVETAACSLDSSKIESRLIID